MEIFDVSVPIREGMVVYEGDPDVRLTRVASISDGATANLSRLDFGVHSGTHVDAPLHFVEGAPAAESLPLDALVGPAAVVDATAIGDVLDEAALRRIELPRAERVIFKTRNSQLWAREAFSDEFVSLDGSGARRLVADGVRLVGIDYLSIGDEEAHRVLLEAGVVPVEGLDLRDITPGPYELVCLPLKLVGSDGAPARAILRRR